MGLACWVGLMFMLGLVGCDPPSQLGIATTQEQCDCTYNSMYNSIHNSMHNSVHPELQLQRELVSFGLHLGVNCVFDSTPPVGLAIGSVLVFQALHLERADFALVLT